MLRSYLKIALRHLRRHRLSSAVNIGGLALGLACSMFIFLFARHEMSYDRFHEKADRIYRVNYQEVDRPARRYMATISPPMGPALQEMYPEVVEFVRLRDAGHNRPLLTHGDRRFYESSYFYADSAFFEVFSYPLERGDPTTALAAPGSIVLSGPMARKYFGDEDPIGQTILFNETESLTVTGVLAPLPTNTHLRFDFLLSFSTFRVPPGYPVTLESWTWISFHTYVLLNEQADAAALEAKLPDFLRTHRDAEVAREIRLRLQPVPDIYLGEPKHTRIASGTVAYVYGLSGIAVMLLLLACFNFMNLSTAHALGRIQEVSLRKVLGAYRPSLAGQFLGESVLTVLLALVLAFGLVAVLGEAVRALTGWAFAVRLDTLLGLVPWFTLLALGLGVLAGSYPAFVLSGLQPARALKGTAASPFSGAKLRSALVVLQFAVAIALIAGSLVAMRQIDFLRDKELGFDREEVLVLQMRGDVLEERYPELRERLLQNPNVLRVSKGGNLFDGHQGSVPIFPEGGDDLEARAMSIYGAHYDFFETLGLDVTQGRAFSRDFPSDTSGIVINESAARILAATVPGWSEPLGREMQVGQIIAGRVIGVVEDFHFASLHDPIDPLVLYIPPTQMEYVFLRVRPGNARPLLASLERDWQTVAPDLPFTHLFLDDHIQQLYEADTRFARLTLVFTLLTLFVACLGLYGLVAFATQLRTKEIGIRKVLGASVSSLLALLAKPFLVYVALANLIAWPLAYVALQAWLQNFAYRVHLPWWLFPAAGLLTLVVAWLTLSARTVRAARADPVQSLRYE